MSKRILFINPGEPDFTLDKQLKSYLMSQRGSITAEIDVVSLPQTPLHLEYHLYHALIAPEIIRAVAEGEKQGYDAAVIGCFDDPCLDAAREICRSMVVTGPCEAAVHTAMTLANRFSIIVGQEAWIPRMEARVRHYGGGNHLASFEALGLGVSDFQTDHALTAKLMRAAVERAVKEKRAEAIILGCTMEFGFYASLQEQYQVPVIDVSLVALKYVEYLLELKEVCGWSASKAGGWRQPPPGELDAWGLTEKYGFSV